MSYLNALKRGEIPAKKCKTNINNAYDNFIETKKLLAKNDTPKVNIFEPKTFDDIEKLIDNLKTKQGIIVDFSKIDAVVSQRMLDFLSGAVYALDGKLERIKDKMFVMTPCGVDIMVNI